MNPALIIIPVIVLADIVIFAALFRVAAHAWNDIARQFPACEAASNAHRREFQSIKLGAYNLGACFHMLADAEHPHLHPAKLMRLSGALPTSAPWSEVGLGDPTASLSMKERKAVRRGLVRAQIGGKGVFLPGWVGEIVMARQALGAGSPRPAAMSSEPA